MTAKDLKGWINGLTQDIDFIYLGLRGTICPFSRENISVAYGDDVHVFRSVDDVMEQPFIAGKPLKDICSDMVFE